MKPEQEKFQNEVVSIEKEMKRSYLDYAMSVIVSRALPDARDGLKPVHRRILYAMNVVNNLYDRPYKKSARIVGDVMGKYHPHGDSPIYSSLVRMAQPFSLGVPLVDGQGNFGSIDGDAPAQMRYTEVRLTKASNYLLLDIDKNTVDFQDNYDGAEQEPKVLPARFPNLLVNGANGIAVGMATSIPTHNLSEVIDACCAFVDNPKLTPHDLTRYIPGPDFPTGGEIVTGAKAKEALASGRGIITLRGKVEITEVSGKEAIIVTEIPYQVNKAEMVKNIERLSKEKVIEGISEIRDETNKLGIRVVIEIKREFIAQVILNKLYKHTQLQTSCSVNMLALNLGRPEVMNIKDVIASFIDFRREVVKRRTSYLLSKARDRAHVLLGLVVAVANIDEVIAIIKASPNPRAAKDALKGRTWEASDISALLSLIADERNNLESGKFAFTEEQAQAILDMKLQRLTALEKDKINDDLKKLAKEMEGHLALLNSDEKLMALIKAEMLEAKDLLSTKRRTVISDENLDVSEKDFIQKEDVVITITKEGYIKRVALDVYRTQKRGGKGKSGMSTHEDDITLELLIANTYSSLLCFSSAGKVYKLDAYRIPAGSAQSKGRALVNLLPLEKEEKIISFAIMPEDKEQWSSLSIIFVTNSGSARRNSLLDFVNIQSNGKIAIKLEAVEKLIGVILASDDEHLLLATKEGKAICFPATDLRVFKSRTSSGVRAVRLAKKNDEVVSASIVNTIKLAQEARDEYLAIPVKTRMKIARELEREEAQKQLPPMKISRSVKLNLLDQEKLAELAEKEQMILTVTENGYGKRTSAYEYRVTARGGQGVFNINTGPRNGQVISSFPVKEGDNIILMTNNGTLIRTHVDDIRVVARNTMGVKIINLSSGEKVVSVSKVND